MISWPAKDPAETLDFTWIVPVDDGDSITGHTATVSSGSITVDSSAVSGGSVVVWISGGATEENAFVNLTAITAAGRTFREVAVLPVIDRASTLTAEFRLRYPEMSKVDDGKVGYWLAAGGDHANWPEDCRDQARVTLAAHRLSEGGAGKSSSIPQGVTSFKSKSFSASFSEIEAARTGLEATVYGRQYLELMRASFSGPYLAWDPDC